MNDPNAPGPGDSQEAPGANQAPAALQFQQAEYAAAPPTRTCYACRSNITDEYFERAGQLLCRACADQASGKQAGKGAFWRAAGWGLGAAILGTIVWFLVRLTGYELGIVAIFVGVLVGKAVNKGARGASGWKYRALAIGLTYASITSSYVPEVMKGIAQSAKEHDKKAEEASTASKTKKGETAETAGDADKATPSPADAPDQAQMSPMLSVLVLAAVVFAIAFAAPFLAGLENIMGLIIIAIALYEAWKLTRPVPVTGPFKIAPTPHA
jgi:hypothetical protein